MEAGRVVCPRKTDSPWVSEEGLPEKGDDKYADWWDIRKVDEEGVWQ